MMVRRLQYELVTRAVGPLLARAGALRARLRAGRPRPRGSLGPPLEATRKLKEMMALHYLAGRYADGAVPVAWVTSGFPAEVLRPLGFHVVYPENHGALCAARRLVPGLSEVVEREGYSRDLCGYARCDLGCLASGRTPVGRVPRPDLLCCCTNICQTVLYWYRTLAARLRVPLVVIDTPFLYGEGRPHQEQYVRDQLGELSLAAERVARRRLPEGALEAVARRAREGTRLWGACLAAGRNRPSPWTGFDSFIHLAPIVALRGTEECNAYYRLLLAELEDRARRGVGGIREERVRLLWDNLPIWFGLREVATLLAEHGCNLVCATYTNAWAEAGELIDPADPMGSGARAYLRVMLNRDLRHKLELLVRLAQEYGVQGAILHSDRSCKPYSIGQIDLRDRLAGEHGLRSLLLEADHADPRACSTAQMQERLEAFAEGFA